MTTQETSKNPPIVRCAIYTRKSTAAGLEQDFTSLDAQREACEAYIASQRHEGWRQLKQQFDDGGFTGANMERPALRHLLAAVDRGEVDCIVVYKVDRLSRSLLDFSLLLDQLDQKGVAFVSITQHFNTQTSMGRLTLNILLSFAQFEREMISERTRDKMAAARRKGKFIGGRPPLGYDIDRDRRLLVVNPEEATLIREIFQRYVKQQSILAVVKSLNEDGYRNKLYTSKKGKVSGGGPFTVTQVQIILRNPVYMGKVAFEDEVFDGEHEGIISPELFERTQAIRQDNRRARSSVRRASLGLIPRGLLQCRACGKVMFHTYSQKGKHKYRYYVCTTTQKLGADACPTRGVNAQAMEEAVVNSLRSLAWNPQQQTQALAETQQRHAERIRELEQQLAALERSRTEATGSAEAGMTEEHVARREEEREREETALHVALAQAEERRVETEELRHALVVFEETWDVLVPKERARILLTLLERVDYGPDGKLGLTLSPRGMQALGRLVSQEVEEEHACA